MLDRRRGTPAEQLRANLERYRAVHGSADYERAFELAFGRIKWPHDTAHRMQWKAIIMGQREVYRRFYEGDRSTQVDELTAA